MAATERSEPLRRSVRELCAGFPDPYWRALEVQRVYPEAFVKALTDAGYLAALIPEEYGGSSLGITEASIILEEVNRSGANSGACHAQMYIMGSLLRHGSEAQKKRYLGTLASLAPRVDRVSFKHRVRRPDLARSSRHGAGRPRCSPRS